MKQLPYRKTCWNWCERKEVDYKYINFYFCAKCYGDTYPAKRERYWNHKRTIQITNKLFFDADIRTFRIINPRSS